MRVRAQHMPEPVDRSRLRGMTTRVEVIQVGRMRVQVAHNAQDAAKIRLQHLHNNHPDATANDPQSLARHLPHRRAAMARRSVPGGLTSKDICALTFIHPFV